VENVVYFLSLHQAKLAGAVAVFNVTSKAAIGIPRVEAVTVDPEGRRGMARLPIPLPCLEKAILAWRPDVVHFHSVHVGWFIGTARQLRRRHIPYVVTPHGGFAPGRLARVGPVVHAYIRTLERPYLDKAHFVHAVSQNDVDGL